MKIILILSFLLPLSFIVASDKVIYGVDNRLDHYQSDNSFYLNLAKSTAAMIPHENLKKEEERTFITGKSLFDRGICLNEKFTAQPTAATCSGFLIAKDLLMTAGHCVRDLSSCFKSAWVFDYALMTEDQNHTQISVPSSSVYKCKEIIERRLDSISRNDFAIIRLGRSVEDRAPLKIRTEGKIAEKTPLLVIGHPSGLPSKIAPGAVVRNNTSEVFFVTNLDTFGGNSGSPVFDSATGLVEGILVRGEQDYVFNGQQICLTPKLCSEDGCRGEDVTRITAVKSLKTLLQNQ